MSIIPELRSPQWRDLGEDLAVAVAPVVVEPRCYLAEIELLLHHETHRMPEAMIAFRFVELVLNMVEQLRDRRLAGRERMEKSGEFFAA